MTMRLLEKIKPIRKWELTTSKFLEIWERGKEREKWQKKPNEKMEEMIVLNFQNVNFYIKHFEKLAK